MLGQRGCLGHTGCRSNCSLPLKKSQGLILLSVMCLGAPCLPKKVLKYRSRHNPQKAHQWIPVDPGTYGLKGLFAATTLTRWVILIWTLQSQPVSDTSKSLRSVQSGAQCFSIRWGNVPPGARESSTRLDVGEGWVAEDALSQNSSFQRSCLLHFHVAERPSPVTFKNENQSILKDKFIYLLI